MLRMVAVANERLHGAAAVARAGEDVEEHAVRHLEARRQPLGGSGHQALERLQVPVGEIVLGGLPLDDLPAVLRLLVEPEVLDEVLRRLRHHEADLVEALASGAAGDLVEVAGGEDRRLLAIELAEPREEHRADRHVDAHAERIRAADDLEEPALGELLDEDAVLGEQAGVVQADPLLQPFAYVGAVGAREAEALDRFRDGVLLLAGAEVQAREVLGAGRGVLLREVDDVDRCLVLRDELLHHLRQRDLGIGVLEGHRPFDGLHGRRRPAVEAGERLREERHVAQGGGHQEEACPAEGEERRLPCDAPFPVGVPVELVHHHVVHRRGLAVAQRDVGQDLGGAAQDGCVAVDGGVSGGEADVLRPQLAAEGHPLLVDQRLDRAGVDGAAAVGEGGEVKGDGYNNVWHVVRVQ